MITYFGIFRSIFETALEVWPKRRIRWTFLADFVDDMRRYGTISWSDIMIVCTIAVVFTVFRSILTSYAFQVSFSNKKYRYVIFFYIAKNKKVLTNKRIKYLRHLATKIIDDIL